MAIKNYTTKVDVYTSIGEIQGALARHGATKIMIDYDNGKPQAIAFGIDTPVGPRGFRLPAAVVAANLPEYAMPGKIETMAALADAVAM